MKSPIHSHSHSHSHAPQASRTFYHSPCTASHMKPSAQSYTGTVHVKLFGNPCSSQLLLRLEGGIDVAVELGFGVDEERRTCYPRKKRVSLFDSL